MSAVAAATNQAERAAAQASLIALQRAQADIRARVVEAQAAAARAERAKGVHISKECLDNPLAKGCS